MKLLIAGASGFMGTELLRQSLANKSITSVIALARKPVAAPDDLPAGADVSKLKSVVIKDYSTYPEEVREHFRDVDACIWTAAITPAKSTAYPWEEVRKICHDDTLAGLAAMHESRRGASTPLRFLYMSGLTGERDQTKRPSYKPEYTLMRGETENDVLAYAAKSNGQVEAAAAKPGLITAPGYYRANIMAAGLKLVMGIPNAPRADLSLALIDQVQNGFSKEPLMHNDLVDIAARLN